MKKTSPSGALVAKAKQIADRLRDHYRLGKAANSQKKLSTGEFAEKHRMNENTMRKLRAFAREFSREELNALCQQLRPNGLPLHWGYIPVLLAAQSKRGKEVREEFQQHAIDRGWTVPELRAAIRRKYPGTGHGRKMKQPSDLAAGLAQVAADAKLLAARCRMVAVLAATSGKRSEAKRLQQVANQVTCLYDH